MQVEYIKRIQTLILYFVFRIIIVLVINFKMFLKGKIFRGLNYVIKY